MMSMEEHDAALARHVVAFPPFTFYRLGPLLQRSYEKPVIAEGLPPLQEKETIDLAYHRLARCWEREKASTPNPSLARALYATFRSELWTTLRSGTAWVACAIGQAVALRPLVNSLAESGEASLRAAMISGAGFVLLVIVAGIMLHRMFWYIMKTGWMMKTSCVALLHAKLLKCTSSSVTSSSTGRIYSLVTSDAVRFDNITPIFGPWFALLTMTAAFVALVYDLDAASAAAGIGVCVAAMGLQLRLGFGVQQLRRLTADATDERVRLTKEVVEASSSVKTMGWQKPFANAVFTKRSIETATIWHAQRLRALSQGVYFATVPLSALAAFSVFLWRTPPRSGLTLGKASSAIAVLTVCRTFFYMSARFAMNVPEIFVATRRMRDFLLLPEADGKRNDSGETSSSTNLIDFRNASFAWNHDAVTPASVLTDLTFNLAPGELVIVTGKVGSGKSSVLSAILSELATTSGTAFVRPGKIALCPQPSWNVTGSVKQNVVLGAATIEGRVIDDEAYRATLVATALDVDVEAWPSGDETIVGEKGVTLSGGQAARLALARAVYAASVSGGPKIAVLDDVLSAVDPKVAKHIVDQCLLKTLCRGLNVGCVLATHQRFCLGDADRVLVLGTEGRMLACAPLTDILRDGGEAAELVSTQSGNRMGAAAATSTQENMMQEPRKSDAKPASPTAKMSPVLQVVSKEDRTVGRVTWRTWWSFLGSGGTSPVVVLGTMFIAAQACLMTSDVLLLRLADQKRSRIGSHLYYQYAGLTGAACLLGIVRGLIFFAGTLHSATKLHSRALLRVLHAPLSWITANPIGRILNRFSSDLAQVDDLLSVTLLELSTLFLLMVGSIVISCVALPPVAILVLIMARASYKVKVFVSKTMNELKRLDSITKSPFLSVFSATLHGLVAIRSFGCEEIQTSALLRALDVNSRAFYWWLLCNRYLGCALDLFTVIFLAALVVLAIAMRTIVPPELPAIALVYSLQLLANIQYTVRMYAQVEQYMTSVERLVSLGNVPVESTLYEEEEKQRPIVVGRSRDDDVEDTYSSADSLIDWPRTGAIELRDLEYRYRIDAPLVLRGISCSFGAGSKNGLVGRTGSGKSSTMAAISRLHDVCGGCVVIDGVDVSKIPLSRLRSAIAVIPQSPSLFSGTVQFNVDPFGERTSREVLASLKEAHLLSKFSDKANLLQTQVEEGGANWSTGERQLICLARALLLRRRIVVVDEATANVDFDTDAHIQKTLRKSEAFESATLLMIAHRISTILDSDQVVVLEHGTIIESGSPDKLLSQPQSHFSAMVAASEKQGSTPL